MRDLLLTAAFVLLATAGGGAVLAWTRDGYSLRDFVSWLFDRDDLHTIVEARRYRDALARTSERHEP